MDTVNVRNLEQIQEDDARSRSSKLGALVLASVAGAVLVAVGVLTVGRTKAPAPAEADPLAALIDARKVEASEAAGEVDNTELDFTRLLSDDADRTTAFAGVTDGDGRLRDDIEPSPAGTARPPPATDRLPVVPLPAGDVLGASPVTTEPKDALTAMALSRAEPNASGEFAPLGSEGGFQIQVASFKEQEDADKYVEELRKRGHSAYRQAANVPNRGLWHRVRIGPFKTNFQALQYKKSFEEKERVSPFIVNPHKVKAAQERREARLAARKRRLARD